MPNLAGKNVGDQIVEILGPITGRNYNIHGTSPAPTIDVAVFGSGTVQVEQTQTPIIRGNSGTNLFTTDTIPDSSTWAALGGPITGSTPVTLTPTADNTFAAIRVVVSGAGKGSVIVKTNWV